MAVCVKVLAGAARPRRDAGLGPARRAAGMSKQEHAVQQLAELTECLTNSDIGRLHRWWVETLLSANAVAGFEALLRPVVHDPDRAALKLPDGLRRPWIRTRARTRWRRCPRSLQGSNSRPRPVNAFMQRCSRLCPRRSWPGGCVGQRTFGQVLKRKQNRRWGPGGSRPAGHRPRAAWR